MADSNPHSTPEKSKANVLEATHVDGQQNAEADGKTWLASVD